MKSFVDVDFTQCPEYVPGFNGYGDTERFAKYGDEAPVYPESDWEEMTRAMTVGCDDLVVNIFNQRSEGSCVGNAATQAVQIVQAKQFGKDRVVKLSAISLYKQIGRSAGSGAVVSDAWDAMNEKGILPLDVPENSRFKHKMPPTGFSTPWPSGWEETAKMFQGLEALAVNSLAELVSSLLNGWPVVVGRSGHSICYCRPVIKDGSLVVKYCNSWGDWGDKGYGYDGRGSMQSSSRGAFAVRSVTVPTFQAEAA